MGLVNWGSLTLWIEKESIESWVHCDRTGSRGFPRAYPDTAIECMLTLKAVYSFTISGNARTHAIGSEVAKDRATSVRLLDIESREQGFGSTPLTKISLWQGMIT